MIAAGYMEGFGIYNDAPTPMLRQYQEIKREYPDAILLFRLGDFYEMFFDDAKIASNILNIALTSRNKNDPNPVPLCGVPYHSVEPYIAKLLENGKKIAICEQIEDPKKAKGIVKRAITRVFTPGIVFDGLYLDERKNNYLAAIAPHDGGWGLAILDASTGFFQAAQFSTLDALAEEVGKIGPREVLIPDCNSISARISRAAPGAIQTMEEPLACGTRELEGLNGAAEIISRYPAAAISASCALGYARRMQMGDARQICSISAYDAKGVMRLDDSCVKNLELMQTLADGLEEGTLFWALSRTKTSAGARKLKRWILYPLTGCDEIRARLDAVEFFTKDTDLLSKTADRLAATYDIERIVGRINGQTANARDVLALGNSLSSVASIKGELPGTSPLLRELASAMDSDDGLRKRIADTIADDPPISTRDGKMIKGGVLRELDELRSIIANGKDFIAGLEASERAATGINSLKIRYNRVFGYYLEVTNSHRDKVPAHYIRKQTLTNAERFITPKLKEYEEKILGAEEKVKALEYEVFKGLCDAIASRTTNLLKTADAVAAVDVLASFARVAMEFDYRKPSVDDSDIIDIKGGRHPIIERMNPTQRFIPNDVLVGGDRPFLLITGPNMAGKSTVMRQTALIALMAQIGSFVPAESANIGVVDRIFTRVGASDAISRGQSTFMVEMSEAATILKESTRRSLIVIDEIGRGTSTYDGLAIAWAIAEELHDRIGARTLFATHYHELTDLQSAKKGITNMQIAVREWKGEIVFLRKLIPGQTPRSYGIEVAKLAGLPKAVIERSYEILQNLEAGEFDEIGMPRIARHKEGAPGAGEGQFHLFGEGNSDEISERLSELDIHSITPLEALNILNDLKQKV
jgi:DNA mismatch repair protein MutS